uniref:Uncharacterized protein n=1 Tax=Octactis speculum TaxID=3111310 RepID=A0A7S2G9Q5_9STRA
MRWHKNSNGMKIDRILLVLMPEGYITWAKERKTIDQTRRLNLDLGYGDSGGASAALSSFHDHRLPLSGGNRVWNSAFTHTLSLTMVGLVCGGMLVHILANDPI